MSFDFSNNIKNESTIITSAELVVGDINMKLSGANLNNMQLVKDKDNVYYPQAVSQLSTERMYADDYYKEILKVFSYI